LFVGSEDFGSILTTVNISNTGNISTNTIFAASVSFTNISSEINIIKSFHPDIDYISPNIITNISNKPEFKIVIIGFNKGYDQIINYVTNYTTSNIKIIVLGSKVSHPSIHVYSESYNDSEIETIFNEIKPNLIWFPSKVPETYCYALSHPIRLGYPIVAYNIGALTERLIRRPFTWLLDLSDSLENNIDEIISTYKHPIISCSDYIKSYSDDIPKDYFSLEKDDKDPKAKWKVAARTDIGFVDVESRWAKIREASILIAPEDSDEDEEIQCPFDKKTIPYKSLKKVTKNFSFVHLLEC
jgi:hypothetical protein